MPEPITKPVPVPSDASSQQLGEPQPDAWPVFVWQSALDQAVAHAERDLSREQAGFLLGGCYRDQSEYIEVRTFLPANHVQSNLTSLTFTHDTWAALNRQVEEECPEESVVGWYHSHPGFGVFLSGRDLFIHRHFFSQPWQISLVIDPRRSELAFFQWRRKEIVDCGFEFLPQ
ncbi:MAG: Mov34/MPN/PAD-1 family protein [Planctomycetales bacterium]